VASSFFAFAAMALVTKRGGKPGESQGNLFVRA
jgi:hypothetical protein